MRSSLKLAVAVAFAVTSLSTFVNADVAWGLVSHTEPSMQTGEYAVRFTPGTLGTLSAGSMYTIQGTTSTGAVVDVSTDNSGSFGVDHLYALTASQVFANPLGSSDTSLDELSLTMPSNTFTDLYLNLYGMFRTGQNGSVNDSVSFMVTMNDGTFAHVFTGLTGNNTNNWLVLSATNGEYFTSVSLSNVRFYALQGLHVSGVSAIAKMAAPEPASLLLLGSGLAGLSVFVRRKR